MTRSHLTFAASGGGYAGVTHSVAVTITDNDLAPPSLTIHDLQIREDAKTGQMRVELSRPLDETVVVQYTTIGWYGRGAFGLCVVTRDSWCFSRHRVPKG